MKTSIPPLSLVLIASIAGCAQTDLHGTVRELRAPESLSFGRVFVGDSVVRQLAVESVGTGRARVTAIHSGHPALSVIPTGEHTIDPFDSLVVLVTWDVREQGQLRGATVFIETNVPAAELITVSVSGEAETIPDCDDGNPCTDDAFERASERCSYVIHDRACDDGSVCTENDTCIGGVCRGVAYTCDDAIDCTANLCDPAAGCVFEPNDPACNTESHPCRVGACDPELGCTYAAAPDGTPCGPMDCATTHVCFSGACSTIDISTSSEGLPCDDSDICTLEDTCRSGSCVGGELSASESIVAGFCAQPADCGEGEYCDWVRLDLPECGGVCRELPGSYVLHEWGVNTPRVDGTAAVRSGPLRFGPTPYGGSEDRKPVLYFYADGPMTIDVGVRFAAGSSTETWPELPNGQTLIWEDVGVTQGECDLTAPPEPEPPAGIEDKEIYQLCEWIVPSADCLTHGDTVSRLLFYAGELDDYQPPISAQVVIHRDPAVGEGRITFVLTNDSSAAVGPLLLLHRETPGACPEPYSCPVMAADLAWGSVPLIEPNQTISVPLVIQQLVAEDQVGQIVVPPGWTAMAEELEQMLLEVGLYPEERAVFMTTWRDLFFGLQVEGDLHAEPDYQNGAFLIYPWPESHAEQNVPLMLSPPPAELARAIVEYQRAVPGLAGNGEVSGAVMLVESMGDELDMYITPAAGATVAAWQDGVLIQQTVSVEDGSYSLVLAEGAYNITAERYPWEAGDLQEVDVPAGVEVEVNLTLYSEDQADKPNIYLYPTETTDVDVRLGLGYGCQVTRSDPEYGDGWQVTVEPDGVIDGVHTFLFYEAEVPRRYPLENGWSVAAGEISNFFSETLDAYGLTPAERNDFVDYWSTHLEPAPYYAVYPLVEAAVLDPMVTLDIDPAPDTLFRLWFVVVSERGPRELPEPVVRPVVREGFSVVEWGVIVR